MAWSVSRSAISNRCRTRLSPLCPTVYCFTTLAPLGTPSMVHDLASVANTQKPGSRPKYFGLASTKTAWARPHLGWFCPALGGVDRLRGGFAQVEFCSTKFVTVPASRRCFGSRPPATHAMGGLIAPGAVEPPLVGGRGACNPMRMRVLHARVSAPDMSANTGGCQCSHMGRAAPH